MKVTTRQAKSNISHFPSRIELLWRRHEAAASEKARIYALAEAASNLEAGGGAAADSAVDRAEAARDAAFDVLEDIGDEILRTRATSTADLAIKARVLALRDHGNGYRRDDVVRLCADVQTFGAL